MYSQRPDGESSVSSVLQTKHWGRCNLSWYQIQLELWNMSFYVISMTIHNNGWRHIDIAAPESKRKILMMMK